MPDIVDPATRSRWMRGIGAKDTEAEKMLRSLLWRRGFRFRTHQRELPGTPDLVFKRYGAAIFVHGCFWHRHQGCKLAAEPKSNPEFWSRKFAANMERDIRALSALLDLGWRAAVVWECQLEPRWAHATADALAAWLKSSRRQFKQLSLPHPEGSDGRRSRA